MFDRVWKDESGAVQSESKNNRHGANAGKDGPGRRGGKAVIGHSIRIDGDVQGDEDLIIDGTVTGTVKLANNSLTIGQEGQIQADIHAKSIIVDGMMDGDLYAIELVAIRKNAQVQGNIVAPRVSIEEGARFKGAIEMDPAAVESVIGKLAAPKKTAALTHTYSPEKKETAA